MKNKFILLIYIINLLILLFNVTIFSYSNFFLAFQIFKSKIFKYSEHFDLNIFIHPYTFISNYLNNKYNINNHKTITNNYSNKKIIKIYITGIAVKKSYIFISNLLKNIRNDFEIQFNRDNPDYLIYNCYNDFDLKYKYKNVIRIALYTENMMPDINHADYALGNFHINYLDRYFKLTTFLYMKFDQINKIRKEVLKKSIKKKFCAAVISNCLNFYRFRIKFMRKLNKYKKIDMGGRCRNNIKRIVKNKIAFLSNYKFSIAMENSSGDGYLSEKIVDSLLAGTIPIYYGDYMVDEYINPKTYILIKGEKDLDEKIEYIKKIDNDEELYKSIMKEKPLLDEKIINIINSEECSMFLKNIFIQDKNKAFRRDDYYENCKCKSFFYSFINN